MVVAGLDPTLRGGNTRSGRGQNPSAVHRGFGGGRVSGGLARGAARLRDAFGGGRFRGSPRLRILARAGVRRRAEPLYPGLSEQHRPDTRSGRPGTNRFSSTRGRLTVLRAQYSAGGGAVVWSPDLCHRPGRRGGYFREARRAPASLDPGGRREPPERRPRHRIVQRAAAGRPRPRGKPVGGHPGFLPGLPRRSPDRLRFGISCRDGVAVVGPVRGGRAFAGARLRRVRIGRLCPGGSPASWLP